MDAPAAACVHCGQPMPAAADDARFCCAGCRTAHEVISACGLDAFYRLRDRPLPAPEPGTQSADWLDSADFAAAHVRRREDGGASLRWRVGGVHCGACVWLLERLPRVDPGIRAARLDLSEETLDIVYDPAACPPSRQAELVARLGYRLRPYAAGDAAARGERRVEMLRLAIAGGSALGSMHLALNLVAGGLTGDLDAASRTAFSWLAVATAAPALTWAAWPWWRGAWAALRARRLTADLTTAAVLAVTIAAGIHGLATGGDLYVDAAALYIALLLAGRGVLEFVRRSALRSAGAAAGIVPEHARRLRGIDDAVGEAVASAALAPGDLVRVAVDEAAPCDGVVVGAPSRVDNAVVNGESRPVAVAAGDAVLAGATARAPLTLRATACGGATRVGRILAEARALAAARVAPGPAERLQAWFLPAVALLAGATWALWRAWDPARALDQAVAMVLVCCPCALGLAAPLVHAVATARAARRGIVLRDPAALHLLARLRHAVFDKTGTLTAGRMQVRAFAWTADADAAAIAPWIVAAEQRARHPAGHAIAGWLAARGVAAATAEAPPGWREIPGDGVACATPLGELRIGRAGFAAAIGTEPGIAVSLDGRAVARVELDDPLRPDARAVLARVRDAGARPALLSGDHPAVALAVGESLGLPRAAIAGGCGPEDKARRIAALRAEGATAMVGDGANDAAALAAADVGIAIRGGVAACLEHAAAYIVDGRLGAVAELLDGAASLRRSLRRCLAVSLAYNAVGMALVLGGWWGPLVCAVAMPLSSLTVIALALASRSFAAPAPVQRPRDAALAQEAPSSPGSLPAA